MPAAVGVRVTEYGMAIEEFEEDSINRQARKPPSTWRDKAQACC